MAFADPKKTLERFHLGEGMRVAELGAGTGAWSIAAAQLVGESGRVIAIDIQKDLVSKASHNAQDAGVSIEVLWGDLEKLGGSKIADAAVDSVIIANTLFQIQKKEVFAQEAARILRKGGKVLLIDWSESFGGLGPQSQHIVPQFTAEKIFTEAGFSLEETIPAGDHHYGLVFRKTS